MTITRRSTLRDVALAVGHALTRRGIRAVLTGGACATIYSEGRYTSTDLDFILDGRARQVDLDAAMGDVGFQRDADRYVHPRSPFWVEFPRGPLAVGGDLNVRPVALPGTYGRTLALSPTDACRDRLAAFYHWDDRQSLAVAAEIASRQRVKLGAIRTWSDREGYPDRFAEFLREVSKKKSRRRPKRQGAHREVRPRPRIASLEPRKT